MPQTHPSDKPCTLFLIPFIFLLAAFALCGGIVIWLIVTEGIRHSRSTPQDNQTNHH
jgi:hypothetical protein